MKKARICLLSRVTGPASRVKKPRPEKQCQAPVGTRVTYRVSGFTLIELSIVLIIIAIIVGMTALSSVATLGNARLTATQKKMATIDQALMAYRIAHNQLPCPSDLTAVQGSAHYGTSQTQSLSTSGTVGYCQAVTNPSGMLGVRTSQNSVNTAVAVAEGGVPTSDLGLPYDFMYDGWGYRFRYAVDVSMAYTGLNASNLPNNSNTFSGTQIGSPYGAITIYGDIMPNSKTYAQYGVGHTAFVRSNAAIYALISSGPNSSDAYSPSGLANATWGTDNADEETNCHCNQSGYTTYSPTYVQSQPYLYNQSDPNSYFDDIVTYKERWQMQGQNDTWGNAVPRVYVADYSNSRVDIYDLSGNYLGKFGSYGTGNGQFKAAVGGLFIDNMNNLWVTDDSNGRIQEFALSATVGTVTWVQNIGSASNCSGVASTQFCSPESVMVDRSHNIWISDGGYNRIVELNSSVNFVMGIGAGYNGMSGSAGSVGYLNGQFNNPVGIASDPAGNIWVSDRGNNRVQEFSSSGTWLQTIPSSCTPTCSGGSGTCPTSGSGGTCNGTCIACASGSGTTNPQFGEPASITSDSFGNIWVGDSSNNRIMEFGNNGAYITNISSGGGAAGVAVDPFGNVWTTNWNGNNIEKCSNNAGTWNCTTFGSSGSGSNQFSNPWAIAIPQAGIVSYR